ncbi:23S rRNA (adenine(2503)-C(2))-methyltransferase RlmN [Pallidibacillus pasinlerensis]|uniref:Probable dual-specificity RNA methyltransferase RlmN n=1 Tax=Pallidibacillus pasinlerensis TaxID=2703818 RepID=A0ABX0A5F7_9BACI|nr:23S rRNA (adenine(2503)-C(2))-methyltransferase RlmN [Pallidibacillus pasinlerensis]NCU18047.1 23S rRNA (adenine(2503)-C(2))-methyltransferase RlmN [Pallidibacillus pasinlerensis]
MYKKSIYGLTIEELQDWMVEHGQKKYRAEQVWDWIYSKRTTSFYDMKNVNKEAIELLDNHFDISTLNQQIKQESKDGTVKFLFQLKDGNIIETVLMRQHYGLSVCVTTQVGCNIGCSFCASGILRKNRDLDSGEIVEQIMQVQRHLDGVGKDERVTHVVVMGIGEPLDNFENLVKFLRVINHPKAFGIGARHITVSTSGIVPKIYEFADLDLRVNLAVSLHAPNNELRSQIMKINRAFPIEKLFDAIKYYLSKKNRRITFEYILLDDVNDHVEEAEQLSALLKDISKLAYVNLIPYNPVSEHIQYKRSKKENILRFYDTLKKNGINCVIRQELGTDIDAACGQLRSKQLKKAN